MGTEHHGSNNLCFSNLEYPTKTFSSAPERSVDIMSAQWNLRNPAVKRLVQELKEIQRDDNPDILAEAMEVRFSELY